MLRPKLELKKWTYCMWCAVWSERWSCTLLLWQMTLAIRQLLARRSSSLFWTHTTAITKMFQCENSDWLSRWPHSQLMNIASARVTLGCAKCASSIDVDVELWPYCPAGFQIKLRTQGGKHTAGDMDQLHRRCGNMTESCRDGVRETRWLDAYVYRTDSCAGKYFVFVCASLVPTPR